MDTEWVMNSKYVSPHNSTQRRVNIKMSHSISIAILNTLGLMLKFAGFLLSPYDHVYHMPQSDAVRVCVYVCNSLLKV